MAALRILQVITGLGTGGAERLLLELVSNINSEMFEISIVILTNDTNAREAYGFPSTPVKIFDFSSNPVGAFFALRKFVADFQPSVIHAHMFHALAVINAIQCSGVGQAPVCFTSHNERHSWSRRSYIRGTKWLRQADIIFAAGQHELLNCRQAVIIPNGVEVFGTDRRRQQWAIDGPIRLGSVGRLSPQKDCLGLVRAFHAAAIPNSTLEFYGRGPVEQEIIALVKSLELEGRVILHGFCKDIRLAFYRFDVLLIHSFHEGMPMVLLEAGAEAVPVISTPVGAIPSILADGCGVLSNPAEFPTRLRELVRNPRGAIAMGQRLKEKVQANYSIDEVGRKHERLYLQLSELGLAQSAQ